MMRVSVHFQTLFQMTAFVFLSCSAFADDYREEFSKGTKPDKDSEFFGRWTSGRFEYEFQRDGGLVIRENDKIVERATWVESTDAGVIYVDFDPKRWSTEFNRLTMHKGQVIIPLVDTWAQLTRVSERDDTQPPAMNNDAEQGGTGQPATRPESKSEGGDKPQPEAEGRSR